MKNLISQKTYAEVMSIIEVDKDFFQMLPQEVVQDIRRKAKGANEKFQFQRENVYQQISSDALSFCIALYLQYGADETEQEKFKRVLIENEIKFKRQKGIVSNQKQKEIFQEVEEKVRQQLKEVIDEEAVGYPYYFNKLKQEMLQEQGISWQPAINKSEGIMAD